MKKHELVGLERDWDESHFFVIKNNLQVLIFNFTSPQSNRYIDKKIEIKRHTMDDLIQFIKREKANQTNKLIFNNLYNLLEIRFPEVLL